MNDETYGEMLTRLLHAVKANQEHLWDEPRCGKLTGDMDLPRCLMHEGHGMKCAERMRVELNRA